METGTGYIKRYHTKCFFNVGLQHFSSCVCQDIVNIPKQGFEIYFTCLKQYEDCFSSKLKCSRIGRKVFTASQYTWTICFIVFFNLKTFEKNLNCSSFCFYILLCSGTARFDKQMKYRGPLHKLESTTLMRESAKLLSCIRDIYQD